MLPIEQLQELIKGKKVAFIGAGVSHKRCIAQFVELGAQVTLCDQKKSLDDFGDYADTLRRWPCGNCPGGARCPCRQRPRQN